MTCTHKCNQGRACNCYRANFDHLGQPRQAPNPYRLRDLALCAIALALVIGLTTGAFA